MTINEIDFYIGLILEVLDLIGCVGNTIIITD